MKSDYSSSRAAFSLTMSCRSPSRVRFFTRLSIYNYNLTKMISVIIRIVTVLLLVFFWISVGILEFKLKKVVKFPTMVLVVIMQLLQCLVLRWITEVLIF